jgi:hypothetical protein
MKTLNPTSAPSSKIGKLFTIKTDKGPQTMECITWDSELREFKNDLGFISLDWMEYLDLVGLGRIQQIA